MADSLLQGKGPLDFSPKPLDFKQTTPAVPEDDVQATQAAPLETLSSLPIEFIPKEEPPTIESVGPTTDVFMDKADNSWESMKKVTVDSFIRDANKVAYGGVKGIASLADMITSPGWAIGHMLGGQSMPFTSLLESKYPSKLYMFDDDPDSYNDELLRISQTGAEFITPGSASNALAKTATKGAYLATQADDITMSALSALGYQGTLEAGGSDEAAMFVSLLAPMSSQKQLYKGLYETSKKVGKGTATKVSKMLEYAPVYSLVKNSLKDVKTENVQRLKARLQDNPKMWESTILSRKAKEIVLNIPDEVPSVEKSIERLEHVREWLHKAIPDSPEVRQHMAEMQSFEDLINASVPEGGKKLKLTLDQVYRPILRKNNAHSGLDEVLAAARLVGGDVYNQQVLDNHEALFSFLKNNKDTLTPEHSKAFKKIFVDHLDNLGRAEESIHDAAMNQDFIKGTLNPAYQYPYQPMDEQLRPALAKVRGLYDEAYEGMLNSLPKDLELDTTAVKDSINTIYDSLGIFSDPKSTPAYVKDIVRKLSSINRDGPDIRTEQLNQSDELARSINKVTLQTKEARIRQADELEMFKVSNPDDAEGLKTLKRDHDQELLDLNKQKTQLKDEQAVLSEAKRATVVEANKQENILPDILLTTVDDVREGLKITNDKLRKAYRAGRDEEYQHLLTLKKGLEKSMEGLRDADPDAYATFKAGQSSYASFVSKDFNDTLAGKLMEKSDHFAKLTSDAAVNKLWENADSETIQRFLRNTDGSREGLSAFLNNVDVPEGSDVVPFDQFSENADKILGSMKDIIYTSLSRQVAQIDEGLIIDPVDRMKRIGDVLKRFQNKHKAKLEHIPGMEDLSGNMTKTLDDLSDYIQATKQVRERQNMSILREVVGPGKSIINIANDHKTAQEMAELLSDTLPAIDIDGQGRQGLGDLQASKVRDMLRNSLLNEFTHGSELDHEGLSKLLSSGSGTRNNISMVLGEQDVIKLEAYAAISKAVQESSTDFTDILTSDKTLKQLEKIGLPLGRIASMLQRRAVFAPSGAYLGGAVASRILNNLGAKDTSRTLKVLLENPYSVFEIDNMLLNKIEELKPYQKKMVTEALESPTGNLRSLASFLPDIVAPTMKGHLASLGFKMSEEEVRNTVHAVLMDDPRNISINKPEEDTIVEELESLDTKERAALTEIQADQPEATELDIQKALRDLSPEERLQYLEYLKGLQEDTDVSDGK